MASRPPSTGTIKYAVIDISVCGSPYAFGLPPADGLKVCVCMHACVCVCVCVCIMLLTLLAELSLRLDKMLP